MNIIKDRWIVFIILFIIIVLRLELIIALFNAIFFRNCLKIDLIIQMCPHVQFIIRGHFIFIGKR
jgi:hypothetical protein